MASAPNWSHRKMNAWPLSVHGACHLDQLLLLIELGSIFCVASSNSNNCLAYKMMLANTQINRRKKKEFGKWFSLFASWRNSLSINKHPILCLILQLIQEMCKMILDFMEPTVCMGYRGRKHPYLKWYKKMSNFCKHTICHNMPPPIGEIQVQGNKDNFSQVTELVRNKARNKARIWTQTVDPSLFPGIIKEQVSLCAKIKTGPIWHRDN